MKALDSLLKDCPQETDIIILPEMYLTGFSMNTDRVAQEMDGEGVRWMKSKAIEKNTTVIGTLAIKETDKVYNRLFVVDPNGEFVWYDKRHLFRMGEENKFYDSGNSKILVQVKNWKIMPLVCYDLRFPVWSRNVNCTYDLLIYVANWPESRRDAYLTLLKARAIENLCYVAGVNRTGTDGNGLDYAGDSVIIDPKGNVIADLPQKKSGIVNLKISLGDLESYRKKFPAYLDADEFTIST
jgi:predicted amidohydrolase